MPIVVGLLLGALLVVLALTDGGAALSPAHVGLAAAIVTLLVLPVESRVRR